MHLLNPIFDLVLVKDMPLWLIMPVEVPLIFNSSPDVSAE